MMGRPAMVVDDEFVNRHLLTSLLTRWRLSVTSLSDGSFAVQHLESLRGAPADHWPVVMTLDVEMPTLNGYEVLMARTRMAEEWQGAGDEAAAARLRALPVVVITGNARGVEQKRLLSLGAVRVLPKPTGVDAVQAAMESDSVIPR